MDREAAYALVVERIPQHNLVNHSVAVECIMQALARGFDLSDDDVARWALAGLLHDLDYVQTAGDMSRHGLVTVEMLRERVAAVGPDAAVDDEVLDAILGHANKAPRESLMSKALYAADPVTGFIVAAALVRPDKDLAAVEVSSLLKRWKEKAFARGANRDQMDTCSETGLTRDEFLALSLAAMQGRAAELGF
jgi:putative nucleotidyltransferase with HDIG domain